MAEVKLIPTMTSNTTPSGIVSANYSRSDFPPYLAFNGKGEAGGWNAGVPSNAHIQYEFPEPVVVNKLRMVNWYGYPTSYPRNWSLQGSIDNVNFETIYTKANDSIVDSVFNEYVFDNSKKYKTLRIYVSTNNGYNEIAISEIEMYRTPTPKILIKSGTEYVYYRQSDNTWQPLGHEPTDEDYLNLGLDNTLTIAQQQQLALQGIKGRIALRRL